MDVFGYGSLAILGDRPARVRGLRRVWGVAMDNRVALPGYKVYEDPSTGERPAVYVAFLDLAEDAQSAVDGALLTVDASGLARLDDRERNYVRAPISTDDGSPAWLYVGSPEGRARFAEGLRTHALVVDAGYLRAVAANAPPPPCPVRALVRRPVTSAETTPR